MIGLGLMLLALSLVTVRTTVLTQARRQGAARHADSSDLLLEITVGAVLAVVSWLQPGHRAADGHAGRLGVIPAGRGAGPGAGPTWAAACWPC